MEILFTKSEIILILYSLMSSDLTKFEQITPAVRLVCVCYSQFKIFVFLIYFIQYSGSAAEYFFFQTRNCFKTAEKEYFK